MAIERPNVDQATPTGRTRIWRRIRFRLSTLLLAPLLVVLLLAACFPKMFTGDVIKLTVSSIEDYGSGVAIKLDAWESSKTGWGATLSYGPFTSLGTSSESLPHWSDFIPTWPKHTLITVNLGLNANKLPPEVKTPAKALSIRQGQTFQVRPGHSIVFAKAKSTDGQVGSCTFEASAGNRLGL